MTKYAAEPLIRRLAVFRNGLPQTAGALAPRRLSCGSWEPRDLWTGEATLSLDLSRFITRPGQYEVRFEQTGGLNAFRIDKATLLYEGAEATPELLSRLDDRSFNVNRTAQVTKETSSVLRVDISAAGGNDCSGIVWIQPGFGE